MPFEPLSESAFIMRDFVGHGHIAAESIRRAGVTGVVDVVAAFDNVAVYVDPDDFLAADLERLESLARQDTHPTIPKRHTIPVDYEAGPDMAAVCDTLNLSRSELIERHTSREYECFAVGFCPGFPYLGPLDDRLWLERKAVPAVAVPARSVAIAGGHTGVYPIVRPGGWWLLGVTPLCLVDVADGYFPISVGDRVVFESVSPAVAASHAGARL